MKKKKKILILIGVGITLIIMTFIFTNNNKNKENKENKEIAQYEKTSEPQRQIRIKDKEKTFTKKDNADNEKKENENENEENEKKSFNKKKKDEDENKAVEINADEIKDIFGKKENKNKQEQKEVIREKNNQNSNDNNKIVLEVKNNKDNYNSNENKGYIDENEAQKKANAQLDKDSNNGHAVNGVEPYDLNQPSEDIIMTVDNSYKDPDDMYDLMFPNVNQIYNNSINYDYPYGPIEIKEESENLYDINYMEDRGAVIWNGYKFTTYSEHILPGPALKIPGRHIEDGFVTDVYGFICIASDYYPRGTVLQSPFGRPMRVYDVFAHDQPEYRIDIYIR